MGGRGGERGSREGEKRKEEKERGRGGRGTHLDTLGRYAQQATTYRASDNRVQWIAQ